MRGAGVFGTVAFMRSTHPNPPRRPRGATAPPDLLARINDALATRRPEVIAAAAEVSVATVHRAAMGRPVLPPVLRALARAVDAAPPAGAVA